MMKNPVSLSVLLLVSCQSSALHLLDSGTQVPDSGTKVFDSAARPDESCGDVQTDNNNCGRCGNVCSAIAPSTAQCVLGRCLTNLVSQDRVPSLVVAGTGIYWSNIIPAADKWSNTALWRAEIEGGAPTILTSKCAYCHETSGPNAPSLSCSPINADAKYVYCAQGTGGGSYIDKLPQDGGSPPAFLTNGQALQITEIALDASNIYWATCYKDSYVKRAPLDGNGKPADVAWNGGACPTNLVPRDAHLYWLGVYDPRGGNQETSLLKISLDDSGAKPTPLIPWGQKRSRFVVGDAAIYWIDLEQGAVMALPLDGGNVAPVITGLDSPRDLTADAGHLYWASIEGGKIMKLSLADGTLTTLAAGQNQPHGLVVDASSVYWISPVGGQDTVMRLSPK